MKRTKSNPVQEINKKDGNKIAQESSKSVPVSIFPKNKFFIASFIIAVFTFIAYSGTFDNEFTNWDDDLYVVKNTTIEKLNSENLKTIFSEYKMGNYHPLAMLSLAIDRQFASENAKDEISPLAFHITNTVLHIVVSILVMFLVWTLFQNFWLSFFIGFLFGVHTIHVESVAWISERKDVLYAAFFVLSLLAYTRFAKTKSSILYMVSFLLFILSLLSKAQAVSLAVTLVLTDYFLGRNLKDIKLWLEKIPFFVFAFIFGIVAVRAQQEGNAIVEENGYSLISRIAMAGYAFSVYIFELVAPIQLSAINPYPDIINKTFPAYYWFGLIPSLLSIFLFYKTYKTQKEIAYGIGFFIINIFLLLQLIPVGSAVHADRYAYIPSIGFFIAGFYWLFSKAEKNKNSIKVVYSFCSIYGLILLILTFQRGEVWQSAESLWNDTVEKSPKAVVAWNNRGSTLDKKAEAALKLNDLESAKIARLQAIEDFTKAVDQKPDYSNAFYNRGRSQFELGKQLRDTSMIKNSISDFTSALQIDPRFADSYLNRGLAKDELNRTQEAIKDYDMAVAINPDNPAFYSNRGVAKGKLGKLEDAVSDFNKALNLKPDDEATLSNRGYANVLLNRNEDAMKDYNRSLEMNPNEKAYYNRAALKYKTKDFEGAVADCNQAIQLNNRFADAIYQRGLAYYSLNEKDKACSDFSMATNMGSKAAEYYYKNLCGK